MILGTREYLTFDDVLIEPRLGVVSSRDWVNTTTKLGEIELQTPIMSSPMETVTEGRLARAMAQAGGVGVLHRFMTPYWQNRHTARVPYPVAIAVGTKEPETRIDLIDPDIIVIDVAHAHSNDILTLVGQLKNSYPDKLLVAGSVATKEGARALLEAGADVLRVGIGPGAACSTRIQTGCGVPQLTAIMDCAEIAKEYGKQTIADGGIRNSGDIVKALAAGADCVMLGRLLAGSIEAPMPGKYFGQASKASSVKSAYVEGVVDEKVPLEGSVSDIMAQLMAGVRSGISYAGAYDLASLRERAVFIRVTAATMHESMPRVG